MRYIKKFEDVSLDDVGLVGGKNASLGEMIQNLIPQGIKIPSGFIITADAYWYYLEKNNLKDSITKIVNTIDQSDVTGLQEKGRAIRELIITASMPDDLASKIRSSYREMEQRYGSRCDVAVRSSATAEDLPQASFAGQQETYLNVHNEDDLIDSCKKAFASLFTDRAISYRIDHNFSHMDVALSIGVQKMVRSDKASAGVIFTLDTETGFSDLVYITSSYGLGEPIVQGLVNPDEWSIHKPTLEKGFRPIVGKRRGAKEIKYIYGSGKQAVEKHDVPEQDQVLFSLTDDEVLELAHQAILIEKYYSDRANRWVPMDIEWAKDGDDGELYIVQARPETVHSLKQKNAVLKTYEIDKTVTKTILAQGTSIGEKIASGKARIITSFQELDTVKKGEILVTEMTNPDWEPVMKKVAGIVTEKGGRTCHAAIVSRELGIPALVGVEDVTTVLQNGDEITIDCSQGAVGYIYQGKLPFEEITTHLSELPKAPVSIMLNIAHPRVALRSSFLPHKGVGLARIEFIIASHVMVHPMALLEPEKVTDEKIKKEITRIIAGYKNGRDFFIETLASEIGMIAAAFYPERVIVRFSDFKSNEYAGLIGGSYFEDDEENPMLGLRGASRYYNKTYAPAFELECLALKKVRDDMGFFNVSSMVPFVRTVDEMEKVATLIQSHGLSRGVDNFELFMMVEIPSNVLLLEKFAEFVDGFSIGSNDLTQMTLGVDRDSAQLADLFDERDEAVKKMLELAITSARKAGKPIGICGQAPSDSIEMARFLIDCGITSISLNPDVVIKTLMMLAA